MFCVLFFTQIFFFTLNSWGSDFYGYSLQDSVALDSISRNDSLLLTHSDSVFLDSTIVDTAKVAKKPFLDDIVKGNGKDSMVYDIKAGKLYLYEKGDIKYTDKQLSADYFEMHLDENIIVAKGVPDSIGRLSKAKFVDGGTSYDLDSIVYNVRSEKAKIYEIDFQEGEGVLRGKDIKKMPDGVFNVGGGQYTTCSADHPHFYLALTKAQYVDTEGGGKKLVMGPAYIVVEDVPLPLFVPFGFFPIMNEKSSGVILPTVGEDNSKGFYVKDMGYYYAPNDYIGLTATGGIYTFGSWEASLASTYKVRYKFNGSFDIDYSKDIFGLKGASDYENMNNYRIAWTHSQDPKFMPGTTFSASVNWSSSNYNKYDATSISDYVSSQTNSSISYSKTWSGSSLSANLQHSQNNIDSTIMLSMPNIVYSVSRFMPFQRKNAVGKQKWYEQIGLTYTGTFNNSVTTKEDMLFSQEMFDDLEYGINHQIPVSTSFSLLKYLNISPSLSYTERWYFNKISKEWDPTTSSVVVADTTSGFYRVYNYSVSTGFSTRIYGSFGFKGKDPFIKAIRHVLTPTVTASYAPDFGDSKYGFYLPVQSSESGNVTYYSPYEDGIFGVPGRGQTGSLSFSLGNTLEMKVRSDSDTTGVKKIKLIESLSVSSSYNFLADSMNLANFSVSFRTTLFNTLGVNISSTFDPYGLDDDGTRINVFSVKQGKLARLTSLGFTFGYSFRSAFGLDGGTGSDAIPKATAAQQKYFDEQGLSYIEQQAIIKNNYYDFSVPWNLSFNYTFSYSKPAYVPSVTQTLSFDADITLTSKMAISLDAGYDFEAKSLTPGTMSFTRDLHCFQISFNWVPTGFRKSWNFTIKAKSAMLSDLKYEKSSSYTSNFSNYY